jgi:broad specificity phosphatase PhoE
MTTLVLIRHAEVDSGARLYGWFDVPLSAAGRRAVDALSHCPDRESPVALYTSPLQRAAAVAHRLAALWQRVPVPCDALREIHCGALEGIRLDEFARFYPVLQAQNDAQSDENFTWPGGESYGRFRARVLVGMTQIAAAHSGRRVAVVTHSGVISQVLGALNGRSAARWEMDRPGPLTATEVLWESDGPRAVLTYNVRHWC